MKLLQLARRHPGATIGLIVAVATSTYIIKTLVQAARPAPTSVRLVNATDAAAQVEALDVASQAVLAGALTLQAQPAGGAAPGWDSKPVLVAPGLRIDVQARLANPARQARCSLDPRPQGACVVRAEFKGSDALSCEYDCKAPLPPP